MNRKKIFNKILCGVSFAVLVGLFTAQTISAHSLYIQSGRYVVPKGKSSPIFFCYGHHFPVDDAVRGEKLKYIKVFLPDGTIEEIAIKDERTLHSYEMKYEIPGTYVLTSETTPGFFAMYIDKKGRKRHSLKPKNTWIKSATEIESSMRSSQWTKAYVTCDVSSKKFPAKIGLPLELVPVVKDGCDITALKERDTLDLEIYLDGKIYKGEGEWDATYGGFSSEAEDMFIPRTKVTGGKITIPLKHSGRWFVRFFIKTDLPTEEQEESLQEKRTTTLSFLVRNERKNPKPSEH